MNHGQQQNDIPASVAVVALVGLAGTWLYSKAPAAMSKALNEMDAYSEAHLGALAILLFATTINCVWMYSVLSRSFGINRQGQRLEILAKDSIRKQSESRSAWASVGIACLLTPVVYFAVRLFAFSDFPSFVSQKFAGLIWGALTIDLSFCSYVCFAALERGGFLEKLREKKATKLSEMPVIQNAIVLGAVEEVTVNA